MHERISIDPRIQHGKPVIRGTRVPVVRILGELASGTSRDVIAREYGVTFEDIGAALDYAAELVEQVQQRPVSTR